MELSLNEINNEISGRFCTFSDFEYLTTETQNVQVTFDVYSYFEIIHLRNWCDIDVF